MKLNLWKRWQDRRNQKRKHRETQQILQIWVWLEKIFDSGQLFFDYENHRLFITQTMAVLMMQNGTAGWVQSVHNIYEYAHWMQTRHAWEDFIHKEEMAAVRKALTESPKLQRSDVERIKHARRQEIAINNINPPKTEPFEFFIIPDSTEAKVDPLSVGYYDPSNGQMEVATWDEVKPLLKKAQK